MSFAAFANGTLLGAGLIIAIGAQNLFVLRQGMARDHVFIVCLLSSIIDALLILLGAVGLGTLIASVPWLVPWASWAGALFLIGFGLFAGRRAIWPQPLIITRTDATVSSRKKAILLTLAFGLLNPHVYLDTVILLGGIAAGYEMNLRLYFVVGAMMASFLWFFSIGYAAHLLTPLLRTTRGARFLDTLVATVMFLVAANLIFDQMAAMN
ncbi:MAG: amino acid transporter [Sneathiella sp.]|nr:MAG: amino acid transporter [Sneathiella sp.]